MIVELLPILGQCKTLVLTLAKEGENVRLTVIPSDGLPALTTVDTAANIDTNLADALTKYTATVKPLAEAVEEAKQEAERQKAKAEAEAKAKVEAAKAKADASAAKAKADAEAKAKAAKPAAKPAPKPPALAAPAGVGKTDKPAPTPVPAPAPATPANDDLRLF